MTATSFSGSGSGLTSIPNSALTNSTISGVALGGNLFNLTAGTGVSFSAGTTYNGSAAITINATGTGGTVTSVAALTLGTTGTDLSSTVATGTTTPVITLNVPTASATNRGALSAADWTTFNSKGSGSVTSVAQSFTGGLISVAGSPITTSGTLALTVAGTSGGIPYFSSATTWATSAALAANALMIGGGAGVAPSTITTGTGVITALGVAIGSAGAFVTFNGALGTPSSGTVTNLTGTASININGTVGATTPAAGTFTTATANSFIPNSATVPTNGLYLPATNAIGWATNSTARMRISATGGVSIGNTTDPGSGALRINGSLVNEGAYSSTYHLDTTPSSILLATGGTVNISNFSGMVMVNNTATGGSQVWLAGGGATTSIGSNGAGGGGTLTYNAGIGGYTFTSTYVANANFGFVIIRTRTTA